MFLLQIIFAILLSAGLALCEVPPPYPPRGFRPSPPFNLPIRQPQTTYGVPDAVPSKLSQPSPQIQYGVPNQQGPNSGPNLTPNFNSKQTIPDTSYGAPLTSSPYRTIISESQTANRATNQGAARPSNLTPNISLKQTVPSTSYGVPVTSSPYRTIVSEPQVAYGAPSSQSRPNTQYDVPDARNVETLEQIRQLNLLLQLSQSSKSNQQNQAGISLAQSQNSNRNIGIPSQQYLPTNQASNFGGNLQSQTSQQNQAGINLAQSQNSNGNIGIPSQQYLPTNEDFNFGGNSQSRNIGQPAQEYSPVRESTNFRNGFNLPQSNTQAPFDVRVPNLNLQKLSQQYLPVKEASNFEKGGEFPQPVVPLFNTAGNAQNNAADFGQQQLANINPNIALAPQNRKPLTSYDAPLQSNVEIKQLNVRRLPNSNKVQTPIRQNPPQPVQPVQQSRDFGDSSIQGASREQIDDRYLPPTTTASTIQRPVNRPTSLPKDNSDEDGVSVNVNKSKFF